MCIQFQIYILIYSYLHSQLIRVVFSDFRAIDSQQYKYQTDRTYPPYNIIFLLCGCSAFRRPSLNVIFKTMFKPQRRCVIK